VSRLIAAALLLTAAIALVLVWSLASPTSRRAPLEVQVAQVLVAKQLIPKGTPGSVVVKNAMYDPTTIRRRDVEDGALVDSRQLAGRAASVDILPGHQLTVGDFTGR
jgi:hypothetical protein